MVMGVHDAVYNVYMVQSMMAVVMMVLLVCVVVSMYTCTHTQPLVF